MRLIISGYFFQKVFFKKLSNISLCLLIILSLNLAGCTNGQHRKEVEQYITKIKAQPPQPLPPLPPVKEYPIPKYEVADLRSPFQPNAAQELNATRPKEALENFPLDSLRLVGIITRDHRMWGLITAPDGKLYQITVGQHLGQNDGRVVGVHEKYLDIIEMIEEGSRLTEHRTKLILWSHSRQATQ